MNTEDYVRAVYYLQSRHGAAKPSAVAERLGVSKNTVTAMVQRIATQGYLAYKAYGAIELTQKGRTLAKRLTYRHRLIELFLTEKLGLPKAAVHAEACRLEHDFSDASIWGLEKLLGHPETDPHGKPLRE
ncbi:MAG: metal-dependent transcriptional regulator [Candidatus Micrarchaeota archaeon]|nr:metal-dependent transcriptional regulator [Candidatus Micrarchaeota archaeon]